ncbi:hypothetical protein [[Mycoplasma] testudinis]|uniref:hypothetical protein n=1 Tax=[Mycoplasma] testudinis TaxID=33924 RepID=UPI0004823DDC|nr:hypothetical protein [[Mycoplasma] testudinis]
MIKLRKNPIKLVSSLVLVTIFGATSCSSNIGPIHEDLSQNDNVNQTKIVLNQKQFVDQPALKSIFDTIFNPEQKSFSFGSLLDKKLGLKKEDTMEIAKQKYFNYVSSLGENYLQELAGWLNIYNIPLQSSWPLDFDSPTFVSGDQATAQFVELTTINWLFYLMNFNRLSFIGTSLGVFNDGAQFGKTFAKNAPWFINPNSNIVIDSSSLKLPYLENGVNNENKFIQYFFFKMSNHSVIQIKYQQSVGLNNVILKKVEIFSYLNIPLKIFKKEINDFDIYKYSLLNVNRPIGNDLGGITISEELLKKYHDISELDTELGTNVPYYLHGVNIRKLEVK